MTTFQIRPLTESDAAPFRELRLRGLREYPTAFSASYEEDEEVTVGEIAQRLSPKPNGTIFGAFRGDVLAGVAGVQREQRQKLAHKAFIWGVYVAPEARNGGMGAALLREALRYAAGLGVRQVNLSVNAQNTAALELYRKMGFVEFGLERDFLLVDGVLHDEIHMVFRVPEAP